MKKFKYLFLSVIAILALDACKKDRTVVQTNNGGGNNSGPLAYELDFESLFSSKAPKTQYFTFDAATGSAMTTSSGSLYAIPAGSLLHQDNSPVTGNVDVKIIEYRSKADMAFSGVTTVSGSEMIESGAMFFIEAEQNGKKLKMDPNAGFTAHIIKANTNNEEMSFWEGVVTGNEDDDNKVEWEQRDTVEVKQGRDSLQRPVFYLYLNYFKFGFCNIDRYMYNNKPKCNSFKIRVPSNCNDTNSSALLMFPDLNSCAYCYWHGSGDYITTSYTLPVGEDVKVLVYRKTGPNEDDLEYAIVNSYTLIADSDIDVTGSMTACTKADLESIIEGM